MARTMKTPRVTTIGFGTLVELLLRVHGLDQDRRPVIASRLRNLAKLGLPEVRGDGPGTRAAYWAEHVAEVLVAFEILRVGVPQGVAGPAVRQGRTAILRSFHAIGEALSRDDAEAPGPTLLQLEANAFLDDAKQIRTDVEVVAIRSERPTSGFARAESQLTIDVAALVASAVSASNQTYEPFDAGFFAAIRTG
jgi:hypothetical protein